MARFYKIDVQPTLFGEWAAVREWGRIGRAGIVRIEAHPTPGKADLALILKWAEKQRRGYR
jgi:predicted DNA-binding WGR domain protein